MAERADAAVKLKDTLPQRAIMQYVLGMTPQELSRYEADTAAMVLDQVLQQPQQPPVPAMMGNGGSPR